MIGLISVLNPEEPLMDLFGLLIVAIFVYMWFDSGVK